MSESLSEKRRRAGLAGARARWGNAGSVTATSGSAGDDPDDLVFGTAAQLREMAEAQVADSRKFNQAQAASRSRIAAFRSRHPRAKLANFIDRPICEAATLDPPTAPSGLRFRNADTGPSELWIDDVILWPNSWGEGISARDIREALDDIGDGDLVVHMNSPGGDVFEGVAIHQAFRDHPGDVYIAVDSLAASIASVIAMAGDTVGIGNLAMMMIHEASGFTYGNAADMLAMAGLLDQVSTTIAGAYAAKVAGTTVQHWRDLMVAETWFTAAQALDAGLADERLEPAPGDAADAPDDRVTSTPAAGPSALLFNTLIAGLAPPPKPVPASQFLRAVKEAVDR